MSRMKSSRHHLHQRGFGLVEIMISTVISLFLLGGVIGIFLSNKENYRLQQNLARIQENARYAMNVLMQDIRLAGYSGCNPNITDHLNPAGTGYSNALFNINTAVGGWEYAGTAPGQTYNITSLDPLTANSSSWADDGGSGLPADLVQKVVPGTDIIVSKHIGKALDVSLAASGLNANSLSTNSPPSGTGIAQYTILLVSEDCQTADLFQKRNNANAASISKGNGNTSNPGPGNVIPGSFGGGQKWSKAYTSAASLLTFQSTAYYIGQGTSGMPSLWRATFNGGPTGVHVELVDGVENMQVLYGEDTDSPVDGVANQFVTINNITNTQNIVSVRISLLMRAPQEVQSLTTDTKNYLLTGLTNNSATEINPTNDKRLRVVTTATIKLRNKGTNL
ncbi:MAG TPA: hypothetical protein ENI65_06195 [Gammaproteobacteria bacterium]|nr:hypothetical protein [Gammaproteobacteria bacterium]